MKVAVIGSGMAGLAAARKLYTKCEVTVFEQSADIGGHAATVDADSSARFPVDIGVNVFSDHDYPRTLSLFRSLGVSLRACSMSFGMAAPDQDFSWSSIQPLQQLSALLRLETYAMAIDFVRFTIHAHTRPIEPNLTLGEFLKHHRYSAAFSDLLLVPMGSAIYTCSADTILSFSARTFITFFRTHRVIDVLNLPTWYNIEGGCREYLKRMTAPFADCVRTNRPVTRVTRNMDAGVDVETADGSETFDAVVIACHPHDALAILADPSSEEKAIFETLPYSESEVVTHTDETLIPLRKECWSSWMYELRVGPRRSSVHYFVNRLQDRLDEAPVFVTINPLRPIDQNKVIDYRVMRHPIFNLAFVEAQQRLPGIQGRDRIWFCGAYAGQGFHEDALVSGEAAAEDLLRHFLRE